MELFRSLRNIQIIEMQEFQKIIKWAVFSICLLFLVVVVLFFCIGCWRMSKISDLGNLSAHGKNSPVSDFLPQELSRSELVNQFTEAWASEYELFIIDLRDNPDWKRLNPWICERIDSILIDEHLEEFSSDDIPDLPNVKSVMLIENYNFEQLSELVRSVNSIQYLDLPHLSTGFGSKQLLKELATEFPEYDKVFVHAIESDQFTLRETSLEAIQVMDLEKSFGRSVEISLWRNRKYVELRLMKYWWVGELESITLIGADGDAYRLSDQEAGVLSQNCAKLKTLNADVSDLSPKGMDALKRLTTLIDLNGKPVK